MRAGRLLRIFMTAGRHRLDRMLPDDVTLPLSARLALLPLKMFPTPADSPATSLRKALEDLGPVFVKFGQALSTRRDLFATETANELARLQDQVPPFPGHEAMAVIEQALATPVHELFATIEAEPLASASVAQVHAATLNDGSDVVVKVIRPGIEHQIRADLAVMHTFARLLARFSRDGHRLHPEAVVRDYEKTILGELNLQLEAANGAQLKANWDGSGKLYVPTVYWDFAAPNVLVLERIYGSTIADVDALRARGTDMKKLAHLGVDIFFTQVFEQNFFHADMHPGNVYVDTTDPANPSYIALDCAIIGSLTEEDKTYLAQNLLAFFHRDYHEVARLHVESGWVPRGTDVNEFAAVIRSVCEPVFQKPIAEISFGRVLVSLFDTARRFDMEVQPQLVLLQKTLLNIEGIGREVYPELDLWETAAPYMERFMRGQVGTASFLKELLPDAPEWLKDIAGLPALAHGALQEIHDIADYARRQGAELTAINERLATERRRTRLAGLAVIAAAAILLAAGLPHDQPGLLLSSSVIGGLGLGFLLLRT